MAKGEVRVNAVRPVADKVAEQVRRITFWVSRHFQQLVDCEAVRRIDERYVQIPMPGYRDIKLAQVLFYFSKGIGGGKVWQRAKGLSYSLLMALPPMMVFLFTLVAYLPIDGLQDEFMRQMVAVMPENFYCKIADTVNDVVRHKHTSLMSIGFVVSLFLATNGIYGIYRSINNNPDVKHANFLPVYGGSILMVFLLFILLVSAFALLVGYKLLLSIMISHNIIAETQMSVFLFSFGRWIILTLLTLFVLNVVYRFVLVDKKQNRLLRFFSVGSVFATVLFFGLTWGFQVYMNHFNQFNLLYGSIGTILMVMIWLFANCYVLLIGYEVNISVIKSADDPDEWMTERVRKRQRRRARRLRLGQEEVQPQGRQATVEIKQNQPTEVTLTLTFVDGQWKVKQ